MIEIDSAGIGRPDITQGGLKYYIFDWDDNILHMPTTIVLEKRDAHGTWHPQEMNTAMFALIRHDTENYRPPGGDWERAFANFRDLHDREESSFLTDTREALQPIIDGTANVPPSFRVFRQALVEGRLFAIVTARGHKPQSIRMAVEYFIANVLDKHERCEMLANLRAYREAFGEAHVSDEQTLDDYLSLNRYHGISSPEFKTTILGHESATSGAENPEQAKQHAIKDFVDHVLDIANGGRLDRKISVGFSDDDIRNIEAAREFIEKKLALDYPYVTFILYDTSDPQIAAGRKIVLRGQLDLGLAVDRKESGNA